MFNLDEKDSNSVKEVAKKGSSAREINRAHALNLRNKGYSAAEVADILEMTPRTVINITSNYVEFGLARALKDDPRPGRPPKFDDRIKARIVAMVCAHPPQGFDRWTLELIRFQVEKEKLVKSIGEETIRVILREHDLKPWQQQMWCVPELTPEYISRMEALLNVYELPYNSEYPVVCVDEKPVQLLSDKKEAVLMKEGKIKKVDYEYKRNGSANVFCGVEPLAGEYFNKVTETKNGKEFGLFIREIEQRYKDAKRITLVLDNFSSHTVKSLIAAFGEQEGRRIWDRFDVLYTPTHASWLNQGEIAIGMYARQCLGQSRIEDIAILRKRTTSWNKYANKKKVTIKWNFSSEDARDTFDYGEKIKRSNH